VLDLPLAHIEIERTNEGYVHRDTAYPVKEMAVAAQLREEGWCVIHDEGATFRLMVHALAQDVMSHIYFLLHPEELQEYVPGGYWRLDDWRSSKGQHLFWALAKRFITLRAGPHEEALHHDCVRAIQTAMQRAATFENFKAIIERNLAYHPGKLAAMQERIDLAWHFLHGVPETFWSAYLHHAMLPGWNTDGWPDLTCVKDGRVRLVELKGRDKLKTSQVVWCSTTRHLLPVSVDIIRVK